VHSHYLTIGPQLAVLAAVRYLHSLADKVEASYPDAARRAQHDRLAVTVATCGQAEGPGRRSGGEAHPPYCPSPTNAKPRVIRHCHDLRCQPSAVVRVMGELMGEQGAADPGHGSGAGPASGAPMPGFDRQDPDPMKTKVTLGDPEPRTVAARDQPPTSVDEGSAPRRGRTVRFANDPAWLALDRVLDDALSVSDDPHTGVQTHAAAMRIILAIRRTQELMLRPGLLPLPSVARRRARLQARDVARRCQEELYLHLGEQRVRGALPRLRHAVATTLGDDARSRLYLSVLDRLVEPVQAKRTAQGSD